MKNKTQKLIVVLFAIFSLTLLSGCANARWGANAGVGVNWGPHGPTLHPHVDLDLYSGGKL